MPETFLLREIKQVLSQFHQYWDNEILMKNKVSEDLRNYEPGLITALLSNENIKSQFEISINKTSIFKIEEFIQLLTYKDFWENSYTKYSNKIGLTANGKYLDYNSDVVLDFPFKDCILEGGMTKEEVGKKEVYYNKVIARDEVDTLLAPKAFTNTKKYTKDGEKRVSKITDADNLIIKGNNLLALHSLKKRYTGKIKLVYLDPPYNTGSDSFLYNDKFNHSSWLTFMKNRLEIAKEILSDDGVLAIQLDDSEGPYLKVLLDSIFGQRSHLFTQYVLVRYADKTLKSDMDYHKQIEQIHYYKKSPNSTVSPNKKSEKYDYSKFIYNFEELSEPKETIELGGRRVDIFLKNQIKINKGLPSIKGLKEVWATGSILDGNSSGRFFRDHLTGRYQNDGYGVVYRVWGIGDDDNEFRYFTGPQKLGATKGKYFQGVPSNIKSGEVTKKFKPVAGFLDLAGSFGNIRQEGGVELRSGKKPEQMLGEIIQLYTKPSDIVLDFFGGSGSTAATAHKLHRRYISIEQMDNQVEKMLIRLKNVINGDKTGISKDVNWQGGGSFIYTELMDLSNAYIKQIKEAKNSTELLDILEIIKKYADLNYLVELEKLNNEPITIDEDTKETLSFDELPIEKQRELLINVMDINQLYVNYSEIDDSMYQVSEQDKAFNHNFYEEDDN